MKNIHISIWNRIHLRCGQPHLPLFWYVWAEIHHAVIIFSGELINRVTRVSGVNHLSPTKIFTLVQINSTFCPIYPIDYISTIYNVHLGNSHLHCRQLQLGEINPLDLLRCVVFQSLTRTENVRTLGSIHTHIHIDIIMLIPTDNQKMHMMFSVIISFTYFNFMTVF